MKSERRFLEKDGTAKSSAISIMRKSRGDARQPRCSPRIRRGGLLETLRSCRELLRKA
jgi:hypothetical protein